MIDINREDLYEYKINKTRTRNRLQQLNYLGMVEVGIAQFGINGIMSGLYIERVWSCPDQDWDEYIEWVKEFKTKKQS